MTNEQLTRLEKMYSETQPSAPAEIYQHFSEIAKDLREARAEVAKLRTALAAVDRIAGEMEEAATPHGYTGQMVRPYSKWAVKIAEALDPVRVP